MQRGEVPALGCCALLMLRVFSSKQLYTLFSVARLLLGPMCR
jgi:hypothetical protein